MCDALSSSAVGEVWHYFDAQLDYPLTLLPTDGLRAATLVDYDMLILPSGSYGDLLTDERLTSLKDWVRGGGWLVALERAVAALAGFETGDKLEDSLAFGVQELGRGRVIYLVDDPLFRGFWYEGRLFFANAVFFGGL